MCDINNRIGQAKATFQNMTRYLIYISISHFNVLCHCKPLAHYYPKPLETACVYCFHMSVAKPIYFHDCLPV